MQKYVLGNLKRNALKTMQERWRTRLGNRQEAVRLQGLERRCFGPAREGRWAGRPFTHTRSHPQSPSPSPSRKLPEAERQPLAPSRPEQPGFPRQQHSAQRRLPGGHLGSGAESGAAAWPSHGPYACRAEA